MGKEELMPENVNFVHIEIVHSDPEAAAQYMIDVFGGKRVERGVAGNIEEYVGGIELAHVLVGGTVFQFVKPNENLASWKRQLDTSGPGVHNISFAIEDLESVRKAIEDKGGEVLMHGDLNMKNLLHYDGPDTFRAYVIDAREQIGTRWEIWEARAGWFGGGGAP
jgi:predicted enzyme related to lactoylglutathione lyase